VRLRRRAAPPTGDDSLSTRTNCSSASHPRAAPGLTDAELAGLGRSAGLTEAAFATCLAEGRYLDWPSQVTARATALGVEATPTVLVAGAAVSPEARSIAAAVSRAAGGR
jgi:protein-disulfide isomerase